MFEDFESDGAATAEDRKRRGASAVVSLVIFGGLAFAMAAALAVGQNFARRAEPEVEVSFDSLPAPEAPRPRREPPPPRRNVQRPARAAVRQDMSAPTEIPDEVPEESDGELVDATDLGPVEGELGGVVGGTGVGSARPESELAAEDARLAAQPELVHHEITLPRQTGGCVRPEYPQEMRSRGIQDRIVVRVRVEEDGSVGAIEFVRGDEGFREAVRRCVEQTRWEPAHLEDGSPVAHARTLSFPFRLSTI